MADVTVTAADVTGPADQSNVRVGTAGVAIERGELLYIDASDENKLKLADANGAASLANIAGIALTPAAADEPVVYFVGGDYDCGGTVVKGTVYVLSATAGKIAPAADVTTGWHVSILGVGSSTSNITVAINNTGIQA